MDPWRIGFFDHMEDTRYVVVDSGDGESLRAFRRCEVISKEEGDYILNVVELGSSKPLWELLEIFRNTAKTIRSTMSREDYVGMKMLTHFKELKKLEPKKPHPDVGWMHELFVVGLEADRDYELKYESDGGLHNHHEARPPVPKQEMPLWITNPWNANHILKRTGPVDSSVYKLRYYRMSGYRVEWPHQDVDFYVERNPSKDHRTRMYPWFIRDLSASMFIPLNVDDAVLEQGDFGEQILFDALELLYPGSTEQSTVNVKWWKPESQKD